MMYHDHLIQWLAIYVIAMGVLMVSGLRRKMPGVGLPLAYSFNLLMNHFFGALIYALPWFKTDNYQYTYLGFEQTVYGLLGFVAGSIFIAPFLISSFFRRQNNQIIAPNPKLPMRYLQIGLIFYFLLGPVLGRIPSFATFAQSGWYLLITSLCLFCWKAWLEKRTYKMLAWAALAIIFPFFTSFNSGFLGYGVVALMSVLFFIGSFFKPRWLIVLFVFLGMYMGLSVCETYFRDRDELREAVWYDRQTVTQRMGRVFETYSHFEFLDLTNEMHLFRIDARLNQNELVGKSVVYIQEGQVEFAHGATLAQSLLGLVPRIIWPDKPSNAGDPKTVTRFTGETFAEGTSVGIGQVMEFYINFGTVSVILGFMILGVVIRFFDYKAAQNLLRGDWQKFTLWFLPALGFMQAGGSLVEVSSTVAAAIVFCILIEKHLLSGLKGTKITARREPSL